MISRIIEINLYQFVKFCCWFKYAAVISVITARDQALSTIHMSVPRNVCENIQEIHYDVQRTSYWRTVHMPDVEVLGHSERNERAQNEITKRKLSVPGRRAYPTSRSSLFLIAPFASSWRTTSQDRRIQARAQKKKPYKLNRARKTQNASGEKGIQYFFVVFLFKRFFRESYFLLFYGRNST